MSSVGSWPIPIPSTKWSATGRWSAARNASAATTSGSLTEAIRKGNQPATLGGIEFAAELVDAMNLYRAGRSDSSLRAFVDDLRRRLRERVR